MRATPSGRIRDDAPAARVQRRAARRAGPRSTSSGRCRFVVQRLGDERARAERRRAAKDRSRGLRSPRDTTAAAHAGGVEGDGQLPAERPHAPSLYPPRLAAGQPPRGLPAPLCAVYDPDFGARHSGGGMKVYDAPSIRNVAVVGHGGCGKTSLVSAMLFDMGAVNRLGRVDDGTTVTDFDPDEIERKISLQTRARLRRVEEDQAQPARRPRLRELPVRGPGRPARGRRRAGGGGRVSGVEVQTEKVWGYAADYGIPRLIVVNRMDRDRASFLRTLESLQRAFGRGGGAAGHPPGRGEGLRGRRRPGDGEGRRLRRRPERQVPGRGRARRRSRRRRRSWREKLVEMVAESNEDLMEEFFEKGTLTQDDLARGLRQAVLAGRIFPVLPASSLRNVGMHPLLDAHRRPAALARGPRRGDGHRPRRSKAEATRKPGRRRAPLRVRLQDHRRPHAGRITLFRVYSGTHEVRQHRAQRHPRRGGARGRRWSCSRARRQTPVAGDPGRRHRRGGQAQGDADRRHALRQGAPHRLPARRASRSRPPPSPSSPRPAATRTRSRPRCTA